MSAPPESYVNLQVCFHEINLLENALELLNWDQETYLPSRAVAYRAEQLAYLSGQIHRRQIAPRVGRWIAECEDHGFVSDSVEAVNVREWRHEYDRVTKLPSEFVETFEKTTSLAKAAWVEARQQNSFAHFQPHLERIVDLTRQKTEYLGYQESRYDALLDEYERGVRASFVKELFDQLQPEITRLAGAATEKCRGLPADQLRGHYPVSDQKAFNEEIVRAIGFDLEAGRIDTTTHPFCTGLGPHDQRLTTRYDESDFMVSLYSVLHEAGHGLYEQGLPKEHFATPVGRAVSLGLHESQSRLWENKVGRSQEFWTHWFPVACRYFPDLKRFTANQVVAAVNRVSPSLIRVEADEVFYDLHIILRFELELDLLEGRLPVKDLPAVWNDRFEKIMGNRVPDEARGCLQDIHWSMGGLGYFPTYTLGNLNSAQIFQQAQKEIPNLSGQIAEGTYAPLLQWLTQKVYQPGSRYLPAALIESITGEPMSPHYHLDYLRRKYQV